MAEEKCRKQTEKNVIGLALWNTRNLKKLQSFVSNNCIIPRH